MTNRNDGGEEESFTLCLFSNASMEIFGNQNTLASFTNILPKHLHLEGVWQVALAELIHTTHINNFNHTHGFLITAPLDDDGNWKGTLTSSGFDMTPGFFGDITSLLEHIRKGSQLDENHFSWSVNNESGKIRFQFAWGYSLFFPNSNVNAILGFDSGEAIGDSVIHVLEETVPEDGSKGGTPAYETFSCDSKYPYDLLGGQSSLLIYTDIITHQFVGDTEAPLLSFVPFDIKQKTNGTLFADRQTKFYRLHPYDYKDLLSGTINSIKIDIRSETGHLFPFSSRSGGRTIVKLKFRKKPHSFNF